MQCKDIDKVDILRSVENTGPSLIKPGERRRCKLLIEVQEDFPDVPPKVIRAKLKQMVNAGWLTGCTCGCRGDFEIREHRTEASRIMETLMMKARR